MELPEAWLVLTSFYNYHRYILKDIEDRNQQFSNIFFWNNICKKISLWSYFLFFFFCEKITFKVGLFSASAVFSLWALKLTQQPTVTHDMHGNRKEAINKQRSPRTPSFKASVHLICWKRLFSDSIFRTNISHNASMWGALPYLNSLYHTI